MATYRKAKWACKTLSQLGFIGRGKSKHRPRNDSVLYGGKYPFVQTSDIKHANFYVNSNSQTYNDVGLKQSKLWEKDTLCITIAANIAETALLSFPACFPDSVVGFIADPKKSNVRFVKYTLDFAKSNFQKTAKGTAQDNLSLKKINSLKINIPDLPTQTRIASILSTYDDLIENNEKRVKALEEMAQLLYTEWFVKFNFPISLCHSRESGNLDPRVKPEDDKIGYKDAGGKMVDSGTEYGKIPKGWEVKILEEVASIVRGRSYSSEEIDDHVGDYYIVNLKSFNRGGGFRFDGEKYYSGAINDNQKLNAGDVVVAVTDMTNDRAVIARPARIPEIYGKVTFSADVVKLNSDILPSSFVYELLSSYQFTETTKQKANGANVLHLKPTAILEFLALIPDLQLMKEFNVFCKPTINEVDKLLKQNDVLTKTRDLLIPQLVTGRRDLK